MADELRKTETRLDSSPSSLFRSGDHFSMTHIAVAILAGLAAIQTHAADPETIEFTGESAENLQQEMFRHVNTNRCVRLANSQSLTCTVREDAVAGEKSPHALLIPESVQLDLNGGTLLLDLRSNSYGVRLSSRSAIRNGTIRIVRSEGKGSQACWHSGISVGAAYGDGGTPQQPGHFVTVSHWKIENMTIDQQAEAAAIQLMSEACHGLIRNVTIEDSTTALLGIGMDWGSVGPITTADSEIPRMKMLWEKKEIYSTHPHDIVLDHIRIGKLLRNRDANDAGVRCSACHRITIRNVEIDSAASAIAVWGGDCGYEFARSDLLDHAHSGYLIENITIHHALRFGLVLNGSADNVLRSQSSHRYQPLHDPVQPGIDRPVIRNVRLSGAAKPGSQGIYAVAVAGAQLTDVMIRNFSVGIHAEDWVTGLHFQDSEIAGNTTNLLIEGTKAPATGVTFGLSDN